MKNKKDNEYQSADKLREILLTFLGGEKFTLDCGHKITFGFFMGNNIIIYNGKNLKIVCTECGY